MSEFIHEFDPTASNIDNLVSGETHNLSDATALIIMAARGLFYTKSLVVRKVTGNRLLSVGVDYAFQGFDSEITSLTGYECCSAISFLNPAITGNVEISYQCVGGKEGQINAYINELRKRIALLNTQSVSWANIINKPTAYPTEAHAHDVLTDLTSLEALRAALERIIDALTNARVPLLSATRLSDRIDRTIDLLTIQRRDISRIASRTNLDFTIHTLSSNTVLSTIENGDVLVLNFTVAGQVTLPALSTLSNSVKLQVTNTNTGDVTLLATGTDRFSFGTSNVVSFNVATSTSFTLISSSNKWYRIN